MLSNEVSIPWMGPGVLQSLGRWVVLILAGSRIWEGKGSGIIYPEEGEDFWKKIGLSSLGGFV